MTLHKTHRSNDCHQEIHSQTSHLQVIRIVTGKYNACLRSENSWWRETVKAKIGWTKRLTYHQTKVFFVDTNICLKKHIPQKNGERICLRIHIPNRNNRKLLLNIWKGNPQQFVIQAVTFVCSLKVTFSPLKGSRFHSPSQKRSRSQNCQEHTDFQKKILSPFQLLPFFNS